VAKGESAQADWGALAAPTKSDSASGTFGYNQPMPEPQTSTSQPLEKHGNALRVAVPVLLCVQVGLLALVQFGDIGFDHPRRLGLDFNDFVLISSVYAIVLIVGLACSIVTKQWKTAVLQICIPLAALAYNHRPYPQYDALQYQHLKGKSKDEVEAILGTRGVVTGLEGHPDGDRATATYRGMTVKYSSKGRVTEVVPEGE
jgi:hypothetical protein